MTTRLARWFAAESTAVRRGVAAAPPLVALGAGCAWGHGPGALAFTPLVFWAWWRAESRLQAWFLAGLYHLVASRSLVVGGARYFEVPLEQSALCVALGALVASLPWMVGWCAAPTRESHLRSALRVLVMLTVGALPPLAAFTVMSPWTAAGVWFPGCREGGLVGIACLAAALRPHAPALRPGWHHAPSLPILLVCLGAVLMWRHADRGREHGADAVGVHAVGIGAVQTHAAPAALYDLFAERARALEAIDEASQRSDPIVVLPENAGGLWHPTAQSLFAPLGRAFARTHQEALVGITHQRATGELAAAAVVLGRDALYTQRVPMPFAMWRPWAAASAGTAPSFGPRWWAAGTLVVGGKRLGVLICWEIGAAWSVVGSVHQGAEVLVGLANTAWLRRTDASAVQAQALASWGALFDLPTVISLNE